VFAKLIKELAIGQLHAWNPSFKPKDLQSTTFTVTEKRGFCHSPVSINLFIDPIQKNVIIYKDNAQYCTVQKFSSVALEAFVKNAILPKKDVCQKILG